MFSPLSVCVCVTTTHDLSQVTEDRINNFINVEEPRDGLQRQELVYEKVLGNIRKSQDKVWKHKEDKGQEDNFKV